MNEQRPEHVHYAAVAKFIATSMEQKDNLFFDPTAFEQALDSLQEEYGFPYEVCVCVCERESRDLCF